MERPIDEPDPSSRRDEPQDPTVDADDVAPTEPGPGDSEGARPEPDPDGEGAGTGPEEREPDAG